MHFTATTILTLGLAMFASAIPASSDNGGLGPATPPQCLATAVDMPTCGLRCLETAAKIVGCHPLDFTCNCSPKNHATMKAQAAICVVGSCAYQDVAKVRSVAIDVCKCAGEPIAM